MNEASRARLSDAWVYAYFKLLKADKADSILYKWGDMPADLLLGMFWARVDMLAKEDLPLTNDTRLEFAQLVGLTVAMLRNKLREEGMAVDFFQAFYMAFGVYVSREQNMPTNWTEYGDICTAFDELHNTNRDGTIYNMFDWVVESLILLALMRE